MEMWNNILSTLMKRKSRPLVIYKVLKEMQRRCIGERRDVRIDRTMIPAFSRYLTLMLLFKGRYVDSVFAMLAEFDRANDAPLLSLIVDHKIRAILTGSQKTKIAAKLPNSPQQVLGDIGAKYDQHHRHNILVILAHSFKID